MNTDEVLKRTQEIKALLEKGMNQGRYVELKRIGANLEDVAYILALPDKEASYVKSIIEKRKKSKNDPTNFGKRLEKTRVKILFLKRSGKYEYYGKLPVAERIKELRKLRKYPEWYLDRTILDLGSYFEVISPPGISKVEERRQYRLIAKLLYDFLLFKQRFNEAEKRNRDEESFAYERVVKRAETIRADVWKEHIQGEKERLKVFSPHSPPVEK